MHTLRRLQTTRELPSAFRDIVEGQCHEGYIDDGSRDPFWNELKIQDQIMTTSSNTLRCLSPQFLAININLGSAVEELLFRSRNLGIHTNHQRRISTISQLSIATTLPFNAVVIFLKNGVPLLVPSRPNLRQ
jgi:hypothetical protein